MSHIWVIAHNTLREAIRDRIFYGIVGFAVLFLLFDIFLAKISLGDLVMIKSFGLAGIYIFGLVVTIFLGSSIIYKELERRTLYFILSKPVSRTDVLLGKFFGLLAAVALTMAVMALLYTAVIALEGGGFDGLGLLAILFQLAEMALVTALLVFLSSLAAPLTATLCAVILVFVGHLLPTVVANARTLGTGVHKTALVLSYLLPNLEKFNIRNTAVHSIAPSGESIALVFLYALCYCVFLLLLARVIFSRREL